MDSNVICPKFEKAMSLLSQRWTGLVIYQLLSGPQRFCTIESSIGISGRVLSERLKDLENQGRTGSRPTLRAGATRDETSPAIPEWEAVVSGRE